jgi:hypothetical protein
LEVRAFGINVFGESKNKETSTFFINSQKAFLNIPIEIFFVAIGDSERNFNSSFDSSQTQDIVFEGSTTMEVVSYACSFNYWLAFSSLNHPTRLFNTSDCELALQTHSFKFFIDERMKFDIIPNLLIPSSIDTELQPFGINFESLNYLWSCFDFNFSCCSNFHINKEEEQLFKTFRNEEERAFLPRINVWVSCPIVL